MRIGKSSTPNFINMKSNLLQLLGGLLAALMLSLNVYAQDRTVSGTINDESGQPLPGVTVLIKGTTQGTTTNLDGKYQIKVNSAEEVLVISYIGYMAKEQVVGSLSTFDWNMEVDAEQLEEVVVIGYGTAKKEDLTGSIQSVTAADFNAGAIASPQELVNGKMPGVRIISGGGDPGAKSTIRIRGGSSLNASNDPLIIIDGMPVDNGDVSGMRNPLNTINPNDIETFTVLKDASATAIYGSRASNGVILITTKKGSNGMKVEYNGNVSVSTPTTKVDVLGANKYRELLNSYIDSDISEDNRDKVRALIGDANTDWQDEIFQTAVSTDHNVSVAGQAGILPYRASVGYNSTEGTLITSKLERTTASLNLSPKFLNDNLKTDISLKYTNVQNRFADKGAIGAAITMDPTQPVKDSEGKYFAWLDNSGAPNRVAPNNPVEMLTQKSDISSVNRVIANAQLDYKVAGIDGLRAHVNLGTDRVWSSGTVTVDPSARFDEVAYQLGGAVKTYSQDKSNDLFDIYLNYDREFGSHKIGLQAGHSYQMFTVDKHEEEVFGDMNDDGELQYRVNPNSDPTHNSLISFFGRAQYSYDGKYLVTFTLRNDNSSRFSEENRSGIFPAAAVAWNIKKESFLKDVSAVTALKLRAGYGVTGQQDIQGNDFPYLGTYRYGSSFVQYVYTDKDGNQVPVTVVRPQAYDKDIKWEETTTYNLGLDYGFMDDRITGSLDVYQKVTTDLLNEIDIPSGANFASRILTNVGEMKIQGVEFALDATLVRSKDLFWSAGFNATYTQSEITKLSELESDGYLGVYTGGIEGATGNFMKIHSVGNVKDSFFPYKQVYDEDGKPIEGMFEDLNGDGIINEFDRYHAGQADPKVMLGFNTRVMYKNWEFSTSLRANLGQYVYDNMASRMANLNGLQTSGEFLANRHSEVLNSGFYSNQYMTSDYYLSEASFLRWDNLMVGYNFNNLFGGSATARVYGTVNNLAVFSNYDGTDPEIDGGMDNNFYPRPRTYMLGVNVSF